MIWALGILAVLAAAALALLALGALLPREHVAARRIRLRQEPEQVWSRIRAHPREPEWRPQLDRVVRVPDEGGRELWREVHGRSAMTFETVEADPPHRLVRRIADEHLPFSGAWTIALTPDGAAGCAVTITERGAVKHPILRVVSRLVIGHTRAIDSYLSALARSFEEAAEPEPAEPAARTPH